MRHAVCVGLMACALAACGGDDATGTALVDAGAGSGDGGGAGVDGGGGGGGTDAGAGDTTAGGGGSFDGGTGPALMRVVNITPAGAPFVADVFVGDQQLADDFGSGRGNDVFVEVPSGTVTVDLFADGAARPGTPTATATADLYSNRTYVAVVTTLDGGPGVFVFDASAPIAGQDQTSVQFVNATDVAQLDLSIIHTADDLEGWALDQGAQTASVPAVREAGDYQLALEYADGAPTPDARYLLNAPGGFDLRLYASSSGGTPTLWYEAVPSQLVPMTPLP